MAADDVNSYIFILSVIQNQDSETFISSQEYSQSQHVFGTYDTLLDLFDDQWRWNLVGKNDDKYFIRK